MPTINQLPSIDQVSGGNQIPTYYSGSGDARKMSVSLLQEYMQENLSFPGVASNASGVNYNPAGTGAVTRTVEAKLRDEGVSPVDFGAVGNGTTNDLTAINLAADYAASVKKALIFPSGYTFAINGLITIKQGTPAVLGQGGIIKFISGPLMSGVLLAGKELGQPSNVTDCVVSGLHIEANNEWCVGIYGQNISRCQIIGNKILNLGSASGGWGILIRSFASGLSDSKNNIIGYNVITGDTGTAPEHYGIGLDAPLNLGVYSGQPDYWKANFSAADSTYHCAFNTVIGNRVEGGYYGLSLSAARYNEVANNLFSNNIRSISVQNNCIGNNISGNYCFENYSSAIHLAYGSIYNTISSNHVQSTRAIGQGMLNCYVGCASNKFIGNNVIAYGAATPKWHIYCGVMCSGTEFVENTLSGSCSKSYIAVESAWVYPVSDPPSYGYNDSAAVNGFANAGMSNIILDGNTINPASAHPGIYLHQTSESGNWPLQVTLERNKITNSTATPQLWTSEDNSGSLSNCLLLNNQFDTAVVTPGEFTLARGRAPFAKVQGNAILNDSFSSYNYPDAGATPDVSTRDYVSLAVYTTPTTVTNFTGATVGQVITVRLSNAVTIQHNNASIILKGATNITGVDSNNFVTLFDRGDAWVEQSRNF